MSCRPDEHGGGSITWMGAIILLGVLMWAGMLGGAYAVAIHRARGLADLGALAGADSYDQGGEACQAARAQVAEQSAQASVGSCRTAGDSVTFVVAVGVEVPVRVALPGLPPLVRATAYAGRPET